MSENTYKSVYDKMLFSLKEDFNRLVMRKGKEELEDFLFKKSDFTFAPASSKFHLSFQGGLLVHTWFVWKNMKDLRAKGFDEQSEESDYLISLLHDLCKVENYKEDWKWEKNDETKKWIQRKVYKIDNKVKLGHGEESVFVAQNFITLTVQEAQAIRWHMHTSDPGTHFFFPSGGAYNECFNKNEQLRKLVMADYSTMLYEKPFAFKMKSEWLHVAPDRAFDILFSKKT